MPNNASWKRSTLLVLMDHSLRAAVCVSMLRYAPQSFISSKKEDLESFTKKITMKPDKSYDQAEMCGLCMRRLQQLSLGDIARSKACSVEKLWYTYNDKGTTGEAAREGDGFVFREAHLLVDDAKKQCGNYVASIRKDDFKQPTTKNAVPSISKEECNISGAVICGFGTRLECAFLD